MIEHVIGGTIDWGWDGTRLNGRAKCYLCTCDDCGSKRYRTKGSIRVSLSKGRFGCECNSRLEGNQAAINKAWVDHQANARHRNMFQGLTREQWYGLSVSDCFYCGKEPSTLTKSKAGTSEFIRNGIDRVSNDLGYVSDNCVPCCFQCNKSKSSDNKEEFIEMCNRVARLHPR